MATVGDRIREVRDEMRMTQDRLAELSGLSKGFLSDVENNKRNIGAQNLLKIANVLGASVDYLLRGEVAADQACPGCPQEYRPLATPKVADQTLRRPGERVFRYVDAAVTAGRFYSYRVSACDSQGHCGGPSAPAQRLREKR